MIKTFFGAATFVASLVFVAGIARAATLAPLASFGGGDGWRAPFEVLPGDAAGSDTGGLYNYLGNALDNTTVNGGNLERGLAFNPTTGHLILVSRSPAGNGIRILDGQSGVDLGALNQGTGIIAGGTFTTNMVGVAEDGAIYVANLSTNSATSPYKIYRWANESASAPTVAFEGVGATSPLSGTRIGDSFDVMGSGTSTRFVAGYSNSGPPPTLSNSFALFATANGTNFTGTHVTIPSDPPANGDFRLGITFTDADTIIGKPATSAMARIVDVTGNMGTLSLSIDSDGQTLRPLDYAVVAGRPLLVMLEASSSQDELGRARIFVYDMTNPAAPIAERKIAEGSNLPFSPGGPNQFQNINGTGSVKFGPINGNVATIYAMSTNNGIQAFELTLESTVANTGDYNLNGFVDAADYVVWRDTQGQQVAPSSGADGDGDGTIGSGDYDFWRARFGSSAVAPAGASVPEPSTLALWVMVSVGRAVMPRRRR